MKKDFWDDKWNSGNIRFHNPEVNQYLTRYWEDIFSEPSEVLVPLCGKSRDLIWLAEKGHRVTGVEFSEKAVRDFFSENSLNYKCVDQGKFRVWKSDQISIYSGDFIDVPEEILKRAKYLYDRGSYVALPSSMRKKFSEKMCRQFQGMALFIIIDSDNYVAGPPFSISEKEFKENFGSSFDLELLFEQDLDQSVVSYGVTELKEKVLVLRSSVQGRADKVLASPPECR